MIVKNKTLFESALECSLRHLPAMAPGERQQMLRNLCASELFGKLAGAHRRWAAWHEKLAGKLEQTGSAVSEIVAYLDATGGAAVPPELQGHFEGAAQQIVRMAHEAAEQSLTDQAEQSELLGQMFRTLHEEEKN